MNPIVLIPARMASTRLPGKPLLDVGGAPMIVQVWRRAAACGFDTAVACDGEEIKQAIERAGGKAVLTDPDLPSGSDRIFAALQILDPQKKYDAVINVQGDMPLLDPSLVRQAAALLENPAVDIATLAAPLAEGEEDDPAVVKVRIEKGRALSFSRAMPESGEAFHHIGIYAYRHDALERFVSLPQSPLEMKEKLEQLRALEAGMRIDAAVADTVPLGVDTPEGLNKARAMIRCEDNPMIRG